MPAPIRFLNPNASAACTAGIAAAIAPFAVPGLPAFEVTDLPEGPPAIVTWRDWHMVAEPICRAVAATDAAAWVIACVSDPGLEAARDATRRPVLGMLRCAIAAALTRGARLGILGFTAASEARQRRVLQAMGLEGRLAAWRPLNLSMDTLLDPLAPQPRIAEAARRLAEDGADVLILGCTGLAGHAAWAAEHSGLPVIEPCQAAAAAALVAVLGERVPNLRT